MACIEDYKGKHKYDGIQREGLEIVLYFDLLQWHCEDIGTVREAAIVFRQQRSPHNMIIRYKSILVAVMSRLLI